MSILLKPIAWLHVLDNTEGLEENKPSRVLSFSEENSFGIPGIDYSKEFKTYKFPLFAVYEE